MLADYQSAHAKVAGALRRGQLVKPDSCERCGASGQLHAHHDDYRKPLLVRWLCPACHGRWHVENGRAQPLRRPPLRRLMASLRRSYADCEQAIAAREQARAERDDAIRACVRAGKSHAEIFRELGETITRARIGQIATEKGEKDGS